METINEYGDRTCQKCGGLYATACQHCCDHELELDNDYAMGMQVVCMKCFKVFDAIEFKEYMQKLRGGGG